MIYFYIEAGQGGTNCKLFGILLGTLICKDAFYFRGRSSVDQPINYTCQMN